LLRLSHAARTKDHGIGRLWPEFAADLGISEITVNSLAELVKVAAAMDVPLVARTPDTKVSTYTIVQ
jgi:hypothetical protein